MLYLLPLDEQNEPKTDCNVPDWGHFLQQEVDKNNIKDIEGPLFYRLGKEKTITAKGKDRAEQLYPFSHSRASSRVLPFLCLVGRKAVLGCLWYYCFCVPLASFCRKCSQSGTLQSVFGLFCLSSGKRFNIIWSIPWYDFLWDHFVANLAISSWVVMPPFGTFFCFRDIRWVVDFGHPPFGAFFSAFPKGVFGVFSRVMGFQSIQEPSVVWKVFCGSIPICSSVLSGWQERQMRSIWNVSAFL